jgi:ABC-2 type transport system permease protein
MTERRLPPRLAVLRAVFLREFAAYFVQPTGYVFITVFVFLSALAAFWQERFFLSNLANLDALNAWFPYLLVFLVPSITMGLWADERRQLTEELILTLPAPAWQITVGKYLAALGIYTVSLVFSLSHVIVLCWLGRPDPGLMVSTYFGYWLMGAALLGLGLFASLWTSNATVAFIGGGLMCAIPVLLNFASNLFRPGAARLLERLSVPGQFRGLSQGVLTLESLVYFVTLALAGLLLAVAVTARRRWSHAQGAPPMALHVWIRGACSFVIVAAATLLAGASTARLDLTSEQVHSLSADTRALIASLDPRRPVLIQAYLSPDVPRGYVEARRNLITFLREFEAAGRGRIETHLIETRRYSQEAREARERYGITPFRVAATEESGSASNEIFLGLVFTCGAEEFVIPAFDRGLPAEYELMRSIRVVSRAKRKRVGVLDTGVRLFGGFDFKERRQSQEWAIVAELRKQYEVLQVPPDSDYPDALDALIAVQPTTLTAPQLDRLTRYVAGGKPALILLDPLPAFNIERSASLGTDPTPLLKALSVEWRRDRVVWSDWNPHPSLRSLPAEIVFVGEGSKAAMPFQKKDEVTSGLQEMVLLYAGTLRARGDPDVQFTPLLETGKDAGLDAWNDLVETDPFGGYTLVRGVPHGPANESYTLAARVRRHGSPPLNAIVVADTDFFGEQFFDLRRRGIEGLNFDNVTFILNAVDDLAGERSFIALRKRRPRYRTLEALEARTRQFEEKRRAETQQASAIADQRLREAQARLDAAVKALEARGDLDEQTRQLMISQVQAAESRRFSVARANIEDERLRQIEDARGEMESSIRGIQNGIKLLAISLPPVPAFLLAVALALRRWKRERARITEDRLVRREEPQA